MIQHYTIGWGCIGASNIAQEHLIKAIRSQAGHEVIAVSSADSAHAKTYAQQNNIAAHYDHHLDLLKDPNVHAIYVSSTNEHHLQQVVDAALHGKHVLCEKPLALTVKDARTMRDACASAGVIMATNHHLRNAATHRKMRELIEQGAIGKPLFARVFHAVYLPNHLQGWRLDKPASGGGVTLDIAVHDIDTLRFTLQDEPVETVAMSQTAYLAQQGLEDGMMSVVRFDSGLLANIHAAFTVKHAGDGVEYHGDQGTLIAHNVMSHRLNGTVTLRNEDGEKQIPVVHEDVYARAIKTFALAIQGKGVPACSAEDGVRSLATACAMVKAFQTGQIQRIHFS